MDSEMTLSLKVDLSNITTFSDISKEVSRLDLNKAAFVAIVNRLDDIRTDQLTGPKYQRRENNRYNRAGNTPFSVLTDFGRIPLMLNRVKDSCPETGDQPTYQTV